MMMYTRTRRFAATMGAAVAIALLGGVSGGHAYAATGSPTQPTIQHQGNSQTLIMDPTKSFAMKASPSVKATPYWGEPKAG
ncbi:hypothetical protein ORI20_19995 [Mycobacterium sp. CVI_P3]|uniref:Uncharacterized protein n=1 Tax=Mycobacterium pinniadriaticum TaxID=2994102 RepID=A0ABT3SI07_9MYCO|nr:hypothetical protein [Mycobacterium pinniadriaticum]MCX2932559.1 hypothetical protein [Mycobacterium pinniadriaticum]MCX2938997.1 hypothetical protein [Mycobacterium pinniadriaticum]